MFLLPSHSPESKVLVHIDVSGLHFRETSPKLYAERQISLCNGEITLQKHISFIVRVADCSNALRKLSKGQVIVTVNVTLETILTINFAT